LATPLRLRVFRAGLQIDCKDFDCSIIKIGRLSAAQLCLDDDKVSRIHAVIDVAVDGTFSIIDMGSVEGTFVNGKRINRGDLRFGDEIRVGNTAIHVEDASIPAEAVPPALSLSAADMTFPETAELPVVSELPAAAPEAVAVEIPVSPIKTPSSPPVRVVSSPEAPVFQTAPVFQAVPVYHAAPVAQAAPVYQAAPVAQAAPVSQKAAQRDSAKPAVHSPRRGSSRDGGPLGLAIRVMWGDQALESHYFPPSQTTQFVVGTERGVDFPMGDSLLPGNRLEVVSFNKGHASLQFTEKMEGEFHANGKSPMQLSAAIKSKVAMLGEKDNAYSIDLRDSDFMWVHLGDNIVLEAHMDTEPKPAWVPLVNRIDFSALNIFLVVALLGSLFVISALNTAKRGMGLVDELSASDARLVKLIEQSPEIQQNIQRKFENIQKANAGEAAAKAKGEEGKMGSKTATQKDGRSTPKGDPDDSNRQRNVLSSLLGPGSGGGSAGATSIGHGRGGDSVRATLGGLQGATYGDAAGGGGLGNIRGVGTGGGGTSLASIGIGGTGTKSGESFGSGGIPGLTGRPKHAVPELSSGEVGVVGNVDGELIRQVIRRNSSKIRACYEEQLIRFPQLAGKVAIRFVINSEGAVDSSRVHHTEMAPRNTEIGNCVANKIRLLEFPRPKGGGTAQVTYPFIFKPAG